MVTGKTQPKTPERWVSIISMEVAIQLGSGLLYFVTLIVQNYEIDGIIGILWFSATQAVGNFVLVSITLGNDSPETSNSILNTIKDMIFI